MSLTDDRYTPLFTTIAWMTTIVISMAWLVWAAVVAFVDLFIVIFGPSMTYDELVAVMLAVPPAIAFFYIATLWAYLPHHAPQTARATAVLVLTVLALAALFVGADVVILVLA